MRSEIDDLGERIATHAAHLDAATHTLLTDLRAFDAAAGWHRQGATSCAAWLSWRVGWTLATSREHLRVARRLAELPLIDEALRLGSLSYCKARAITRVATPANEQLLLENAQHATGSQLERLCRKYAAVLRAADAPTSSYDRERRYVRRQDLEDGMVKLEAVLHPEEAAAVWAALDAVARRQASTTNSEPLPRTRKGEPNDRARSSVTSQASATLGSGQYVDTSSAPLGHDGPLGPDSKHISTPRTPHTLIATSTTNASSSVAPRKSATQRAFDRADALVAIAQGVLRGERTQTPPVELVVTVAADTLSHPTLAAEPIAMMADGTCVHAETARRLACDCGVVHAVEDAAGNSLSIGRKTRTIPSAMKRALLKRDHTCRFPGCSNRMFVEGHHIVHWANSGETSLANLVTLCSHHHRFVHEYGYSIALDADQQPQFFDARGRNVVAVPPRPSPDVLGMRALVATYDVSAETSAPGWDGTPMNYHWAVADLARADGWQ